jgi:hypothetical protein
MEQAVLLLSSSVVSLPCTLRNSIALVQRPSEEKNFVEVMQTYGKYYGRNEELTGCGKTIKSSLAPLPIPVLLSNVFL